MKIKLKKPSASDTHSTIIFISLLAFLTAIACGFIAIGFRYLIFGFSDLFLVKFPEIFGDFGKYIFIITPAIGGIIVGLLIYFFAKEAKGHGVPEVMAAIATKKGKIRARVVGIKALASSICIGSGGSAGREGPIVQMGSTTGSIIAQKLKLSSYHTKLLVACGAAAGISATFNTPIAAVIFSLELIIREFKTRSFIPIVISSVIATIISRNLLHVIGQKENFIFEVPAYTLETPWEIIFYLILGLIAGLIAILYVRSLYGFEDLFDKIKIPSYIKPAIGGLCVGIIGFILLSLTNHLYIFGVGYDSIDLIFTSQVAILVLFSLIFLKIIATSLTLGSGGSGGIFAPSLYIGAMTGGAFGFLVHQQFPAMTSSYEAYAIVGMAAVFAGASRATLTAIMIVFEMTGNYAIILPLMFSCVIADAVGYFGLKKESIYTIKLKRRGILIETDMNVNLMKTSIVQEIMKKNIQVVNPEMLVKRMHDIMEESKISMYPVVDKEKNLIGIVTRSDVKNALIAGESKKSVQDIMNTSIITAYPNETLETVLNIMVDNQVGRLPVVDIKDKRRIIGIITKEDILKTYQDM